MPDQEKHDRTPQVQDEFHPTGAPPVGLNLDRPVDPKPDSPTQAADSTVGTGTSIALGCIVGTLVLIVFGLIFLGIVALIN